MQKYVHMVCLLHVELYKHVEWTDRSINQSIDEDHYMDVDDQSTASFWSIALADRGSAPSPAECVRYSACRLSAVCVCVSACRWKKWNRSEGQCACVWAVCAARSRTTHGLRHDVSERLNEFSGQWHGINRVALIGRGACECCQLTFPATDKSWPVFAFRWVARASWKFEERRKSKVTPIHAVIYWSHFKSTAWIPMISNRRKIISTRP